MKTLAYLASSSAMKEKSFITLTPELLFLQFLFLFLLFSSFRGRLRILISKFTNLSNVEKLCKAEDDRNLSPPLGVPIKPTILSVAMLSVLIYSILVLKVTWLDSESVDSSSDVSEDSSPFFFFFLFLAAFELRTESESSFFLIS